MATIQMEIAEDNPDKWVEVLNNCLNLKEGEEKNKLLKEFFSKASNYLTEEKHSNSENYAKILAEEAIFIGSADVIAGQTKFTKAANICRSVPFIHLSYAQYEVRNGNLDNALKVLQFGKTATGCYIFDQPIAKLKIDISARKLNASAPLKNRTNTDTPQKTETKKEMILKTPTLLRNRFKPLDSIYCDIKTPSPPNNSTWSIMHQTISNTAPHRLSFSVTKTFPDHFKFDLPSLSNSKPSTKHVAASASKSKGKAIGPQRVLRSLESSLETADEKSSNANDQNDATNPLRSDPLVSNVDSTLLASPVPPSFSVMGSNQPPKSPPIPLLIPEDQNAIEMREKSPVKPEIRSVQGETKEMPPPRSLPPQRVFCPKPAVTEPQVDLPRLCVNNKNYLVLKQLGEGGSSKVSQVFCLQSKTTMAVKQVSLKGADEPTKNEFKNEIEFLMKLRRNPYIVHLYDYQLTHEHIFLVLECGSTDLAKLIQSRKSQNNRLEIYEIRYFWKKMLHAVYTIHQHGVIHRDLKPANFVFVEGHLKLIDFGISNSIQSDATSIIKETQCGTLNYMAPEAIMDMSGGYNPEAPQFKISPRADVWSLGCILYSMMYGRTPFQHIKHQMLKLNAITNPQHRIEFPEFKDQRLWKIAQNCLQRNPKNRATVEQLLEFS